MSRKAEACGLRSSQGALVCFSFVAMAVASQERSGSGGVIWSKKRAGGMDGGGGLKKEAKAGGAVVQAGGIVTGDGKSGFSFGKLFSCFHRPITADGDDAVPKLVVIGDDAEELDSPASGDLKVRVKGGLCDEAELDDGAIDRADDYHVDEIFLSAREDVEGLYSERRFGIDSLLHALCVNKILCIDHLVLTVTMMFEIAGMLIPEPSCMHKLQVSCCGYRVNSWQ